MTAVDLKADHPDRLHGWGYVDKNGKLFGFTEEERKAALAAFDAEVIKHRSRPAAPVAQAPARRITTDSDGNQVESHDGCTFVYLKDNPNRDLDMALTGLAIAGVSKPLESILGHLCKEKPSARFTFLDNTSEDGGANATMLQRNGDKKYTALIETGGCRFTYAFGIDGSEFYGSSGYKPACAPTPVSAPAGSGGGGGSGGQLSLVGVEVEIVCGGLSLGCDSDRKLTLSGGPGRFDSDNGKGSRVVVTSGSNGLAGSYSFFVSWGKGTKSCSGRVPVSGLNRTVKIKLHTSCSDAGTREY